MTVQDIFSRQGPRFLQEDLADIVIIYDSINAKGFEIVPYKQDTIWIVGRKDHPLFIKHTENKLIYFKETLNFEHISFHEGGVLDERIVDARRKAGRTSKYDTKVLRINSLLKCVEAELGLGVIGERDVQPHLKNSNLKGLQLTDLWASRRLVCVFPKGQAVISNWASIIQGTCFVWVSNRRLHIEKL